MATAWVISASTSPNGSHPVSQWPAELLVTCSSSSAARTAKRASSVSRYSRPHVYLHSQKTETKNYAVTRTQPRAAFECTTTVKSNLSPCCPASTTHKESATSSEDADNNKHY